MKVNQEKIDNYLKKIHGSICPLCNNNAWTISNQVFQTLEFDYNGLPIGGASYPVVPLTCQYCGNTYFINALISGLIEKEPPTSISIPNTSSESNKEK